MRRFRQPQYVTNAERPELGNRSLVAGNRLGRDGLQVLWIIDTKHCISSVWIIPRMSIILPCSSMFPNIFPALSRSSSGCHSPNVPVSDPMPVPHIVCFWHCKNELAEDPWSESEPDGLQ